MKKNFFKQCVLALAVAASGSAFAAGAVGTGPNPYSDCGIGAALFKDVHWAAVTSNVTFDLGTTAVTSATFSPETCTKRNMKAAMLIRDTYAQIMEDAARGEGQHLAAALDVFSCTGASQGAATQAVRSDVGQAVSATGFNQQGQLEKASQLFNIINTAARNNCTA